MQVTTIGLDIAKNVFQVHGVDGHGKTVMRKQLRRDEVASYFARLPACLIGIELRQRPPLGSQARKPGS